MIRVPGTGRPKAVTFLSFFSLMRPSSLPDLISYPCRQVPASTGWPSVCHSRVPYLFSPHDLCRLPSPPPCISSLLPLSVEILSSCSLILGCAVSLEASCILLTLESCTTWWTHTIQGLVAFLHCSHGAGPSLGCILC